MPPGTGIAPGASTPLEKGGCIAMTDLQSLTLLVTTTTTAATQTEPLHSTES